MDDATLVNEIICPSCQASVDAALTQCPQCHASLIAPDQAPRMIRSNSALNKPWVIVLLLLHVGILGIPYYWKLKYSVSTRLFIIAASIAYTVFAVGAIVLFLYWIALLFRNV